MSWGKGKDLGAYILPKFAAAETDVTAGGAGDNTEVNGAWIDTQGFESLEFLMTYTATLAAAATLSLAANVQDADDISGTGAADVSTDYLSALPATVVSTGATGGSTNKGAYALGIDLTMCKRYVRVQFTPNLSAANTDTAKIGATYLLGGAKYPPANTARTNLRA